MISIRAERPCDFESIHAINQAAFNGDGEAGIVKAARADKDNMRLYVSLVAVSESDEVVGHVLFTPVTLLKKGATLSLKAMGLGPVCVLPTLQNGGIGSRLINEAIKECERAQEEVLCVLGHHSYYPRFGFASAVDKNVRYNDAEDHKFDEHFFVRELHQGVLEEASEGDMLVIKYHSAFAE